MYWQASTVPDAFFVTVDFLLLQRPDWSCVLFVFEAATQNGTLVDNRTVGGVSCRSSPYHFLCLLHLGNKYDLETLKNTYIDNNNLIVAIDDM